MSTPAKEKQIRADFRKAVNMSPAKLEKWLKSQDSRQVGVDPSGVKNSGKESVGHRSGKKIVRILRRRKNDLTKGDYDHMRKVVGYVKRHSKQRPQGEVKKSRWRHSLMNWGHDPLKK